jgi:hypothetical protein
MKNWKEYQNNDEYPSMPSRPTLARNPTVEEARKYADALEAYNSGRIDVGAERKAWYEKQNQLQEQFKADALEEAGLSHHPKKDLIFEKAKTEGHGESLQVVYDKLMDLADFVTALEAKEISTSLLQ